jgi:hypothetical protein
MQTARKIVGNGSIPPLKLNTSLTSARVIRQHCHDLEFQPDRAAETEPKVRKRKIPVPNIWAAVLIMFEKDVSPLVLFISLFVMANYVMLVPLQDVIRRRYDFNDLQVEFCYTPFAMGSVAGSLIVGALPNWNYARVARSIGVTRDRKRGDDLRNFPIEPARLDLMWPWTFLAVAMIIAWGWVVDSNSNNITLAAPMIILFFACAGISAPVSVLIRCDDISNTTTMEVTLDLTSGNFTTKQTWICGDQDEEFENL